jgi:predicted permease
MTDTLFQAYFPLLFWSGLGILLFRFLPDSLPRLLGRSLYWVGIPLEILALARQTNFANQVGLAPLVTIATLLTGLVLAWTSLQIVKRFAPSQQEQVKDEAAEAAVEPTAEKCSAAIKPPIPDQSASQTWEVRSRRGSFILSSMIGNTGFVGLAIAPNFVPDEYLGWIVFYSVTHNVVGTYGIGVFLSSYFGRSVHQISWRSLVRDVLTVPSLWAFTIGYLTRSVKLPPTLETGLHSCVWVVIPAALLLMGMRLSQLQGWKSLRLALVPTALKVIVIPALVGVGTALMGLSADPRLALVLMSGMPTAFAGLILAEEYELDRELIASSILLTTVMLLVTIPVWLVVFGDRTIPST